MNVPSGAFEYPAWMPRRPGAAAAALALNAALGLALLLCFRTPVAPESSDSVGTLLWLHLPAALPKRTERQKHDTARPMTSNPRARAEALSPIAPSAAPAAVAPTGAPVDWWAEAERVVRARARAAASATPSNRIDLHIGSQAEAPAHHAGESYRDEFGDNVVWVSDKCYIESDPPLPGTEPAFAAARVTRTVCPGNSSAPRGDLFKDAPAYRKYHPEEP